MKRAILSWIGIIVLVGGSGSAYVYWQNSNKATAENAQARQEAAKRKHTSPDTTKRSPNQATQQPGVFEDYQEGLVASTDGVTLLFFHAPWCPQCRMIEADIKSAGVPNGVTILKVDYDSNQALRQKYNVTLQTTFVEVDGEGNEIEKYVAYNEPTFDSVKANLLNE